MFQLLPFSPIAPLTKNLFEQTFFSISESVPILFDRDPHRPSSNLHYKIPDTTWVQNRLDRQYRLSSSLSLHSISVTGSKPLLRYISDLIFLQVKGPPRLTVLRWWISFPKLLLHVDTFHLVLSIVFLLYLWDHNLDHLYHNNLGSRHQIILPLRLDMLGNLILWFSQRNTRFLRSEFDNLFTLGLTDSFISILIELNHTESEDFKVI